VGERRRGGKPQGGRSRKKVDEEVDMVDMVVDKLV